jgi:hypothetical protein
MVLRGGCVLLSALYCWSGDRSALSNGRSTVCVGMSCDGTLVAGGCTERLLAVCDSSRPDMGPLAQARPSPPPPTHTHLVEKSLVPPAPQHPPLPSPPHPSIRRSRHFRFWGVYVLLWTHLCS